MVVSNKEDAIAEADVVILAVPEVTIGAVSEKIIPGIKPGALVMTLYPAAPLNGVIHHRDDLGYVIARTARPILFNENWKRIFEMDDIRQQVRDITNQ